MGSVKVRCHQTDELDASLTPHGRWQVVNVSTQYPDLEGEHTDTEEWDEEEKDPLAVPPAVPCAVTRSVHDLLR